MLVILSIIGLVISLYSIYVSYSGKKQICDISENVSCSKAMKSKFSNVFGIKNAYFGIVFYLFVLFIPNSFFALFGSGLALLFSVYLAYISYFKEKNFCIVCNIAYLVNILIFIRLFF